ncbi:YdeI/OmpD-associated family protein [Bacillus sp. J33]
MHELEQHPECLAFFNTLAPSCKHSYIEWISSAKCEETKNKRLGKMI